MTPSSLPVYSAPGFINREKEIALVRNRLEALLERRTVEQRTFIFTGQHGIGKSWFLLHLHHELARIRDVKVLHLDLATYLGDLSPQAALLQICAEISNELLSGGSMPHTGPDAAAGFLVNAIKRSLNPQQVLVILLDTVFEAPGDLLGTLENYLLAPLAIERNVLMVLAGRGREYPWKTPELRLHAEFHKLELFDEAATAQQLRQYVPNSFSRAGEIFHISRGNPKTTLLLAVNGNSIAVLNQVIEEMLPLVAQDERILMHEYLEALSIPRGFDQGHLPHLLNVYYATQTVYPRRDLRLILDRLLEPGLIYWNTELLTYTLHEAMRNLLLHYLYRAKPELWHKLHECCIALYQCWVVARSPGWQQWQKELEYHQLELNDNRSLSNLE